MNAITFGCDHHWHTWRGRLSDQRECCKCHEVYRAWGK